MNISGLSKASVLAALYNASQPQGMGFLQYDPTPMTAQEAEVILEQTTDFDYLKGRVMKISLSKDEVDTWGYNRDNGDGAAEKTIDALRQSGDANAKPISETHEKNTQASAEDTEAHLDDKSYRDGGVFHLGLSDVKHKLGPAVRRVKNQE